MTSFTVYWQPGCTSCLKTKEFLRAHGIPFESVNVREDAGAMRAARAARREDRAGRHARRRVRVRPGPGRSRALRRRRGDPDASSPMPVLVARLIALLDLAAAYAERLPGQLVADEAARPRAHLSRPRVPRAADRGRVSRRRARRPIDVRAFRAPAAGARPSPARMLHDSRAACRRRWPCGGRSTRRGLPASLDTYYGMQPLPGVLERTTWHVAQHVRQLERVLDLLGVHDRPSLPATLLEHLPLPADAWDAEVPLS